MHFEGRALRSYNRCAKRAVEKAILLQAEEELFTLASFHTEVQLHLTGPYTCKRATGMKSFCRGKLSISHHPVCLSTSACNRERIYALFQDIQV